MFNSKVICVVFDVTVRRKKKLKFLFTRGGGYCGETGFPTEAI